jgi:hypothetical protein
MKRSWLLSLFGILAAGLALTGCPKNSSPTAPTPPAPTNTFTITNTPCGYPGNTCTYTFTATPTNSPTLTATGTPTPTPTKTNTFTVTSTPTNSATSTSTSTPCGYPGNTCTPTTTPTPAATPTPNPNGPIIVALVSGYLAYASEGVFVSNSAGTTGVGNDGVTMITQGVTTAMEYIASDGTPQNFIDQLNNNYGFPSTIVGDYFTAQTYPSDGQVFQFEVSVGGTVYSNSITYIVDTSAAMTVVSGTGIQCTWTSGLTNRDFVSITNSDEIGAGTVTQIGPPLPSDPCTIFNSAFKNESTPGSGSDDVLFWLTQIQNSAFPGSNSQSAAGSIDATFYYPY